MDTVPGSAAVAAASLSAGGEQRDFEEEWPGRRERRNLKRERAPRQER